MNDGKYPAREQMIFVLGITSEGFKIPVDLIQATTAYHCPVHELLANLKEREWALKKGFQFPLMAPEGLRKAVEAIFDHSAFIQRCQWHI